MMPASDERGDNLVDQGENDGLAINITDDGEKNAGGGMSGGAGADGADAPPSMDSAFGAPDFGDRKDGGAVGGGELEPGSEEEKRLYMSVLFIGSLVELYTAAKLCDDISKYQDCTNEFGFAVAVGTISLFVSLCFLAAGQLSPGFFDPYEKVLAVFMASFWTAGVGVVTFKKPFTIVGNGYFSSWACLFASFLYLRAVLPQVGAVTSRVKEMSGISTAILIVAVASGIELLEASIVCDEISECKDEYGYGVSIGVISLVASVAHISISALAPFQLYTAGVLFILWIAAAAVLTEEKPFVVPGNGYFATWAALAGSGYWMNLALNERGAPAGGHEELVD